MPSSKELANQEFMEYIEYDKLMDVLNYAPTNGMYEELMKREDNVLQTVNRVVDHSNKRQLESQEVVNMSLMQNLKNFGNTMYKMFDELFKVKTYEDVMHVFRNSERVIYMGVMVIIISLFMYFSAISS